MSEYVLGCGHKQYGETGRCAEMSCSNYVNKHSGEPPTDGYTSTPTHLRIYKDEGNAEHPWTLDGADDEGNYTEDVRCFKSVDEAIGCIADFLKDNEEVVEWKWRKR